MDDDYPLGVALDSPASLHHAAPQPASAAPPARPRGAMRGDGPPQPRTHATEWFGLDACPTLVVPVGGGSSIHIARLRSEERGTRVDVAMPSHVPLMMSLALAAMSPCEVRVGAHPVELPAIRPGHSLLYGLGSPMRFALAGPFDLLHFVIPAPALFAFVAKGAAQAPQGIRLEREPVCDDPVLKGLGQSLLPTLAATEAVEPLYVHHLVCALLAHIGHRYLGMPLPAPPARRAAAPGLVPWQVQRAKELMAASLDDSLDLEAIAAACRLSTGRFVRGFRQCTGMPPYRWLRWYRVERAKELLADTAMPLADVAYACGFADQSHFTRVFSAWAGITPGGWRRQHAAPAP
ncbi:helix-turn-helix domain-containing protein [Frateuria defendens]|uniref:helix-turn-helix domain-containing protein n=1 Tax=Frateuria defendens TaxID=2219559 RepID=UPI00066FDB6C|nr:AraC family transcriptional regulator [Frateuria defendens]